MKKAFFKISLEDKQQMLNQILWNATIENKKLAKINFKESFDVLANCSKNHDINNLRATSGWNRNFGKPSKAFR